MPKRKRQKQQLRRREYKKVNVSYLLNIWIILLSSLAIVLGISSIQFVDMYPIPAYSELNNKATVIKSLEKRATGRFAGHHYVLTDVDGCSFNISGDYNSDDIAAVLSSGTEIQIKWYEHGFWNRNYAEEVLAGNQVIVTYTNSNATDELFFKLLGWILVVSGISGTITYIVLCKKSPVYYRK